MKILINRQVGSGRVRNLAAVFVDSSKTEEVLPGNHRVGRSLFAVGDPRDADAGLEDFFGLN